MKDRKTIAISEIVKIIEECRYNDELVEGYKSEILRPGESTRLEGQKEPKIASYCSGGAISGGNLILRRTVNIPNLLQ